MVKYIYTPEMFPLQARSGCSTRSQTASSWSEREREIEGKGGRVREKEKIGRQGGREGKKEKTDRNGVVSLGRAECRQ